jgi:hypothetical protein
VGFPQTSCQSLNQSGHSVNNAATQASVLKGGQAARPLDPLPFIKGYTKLGMKLLPFMEVGRERIRALTIKVLRVKGL